MSHDTPEAKIDGTNFLPERYAILFTDLVGSSVLNARLGDDEYKAQVLFPLLEFQRESIRNHSGILGGDPAGDSIMSVFLQTNDALQAALELLRKTKEWNESGGGGRKGEEVWVRIGVHYSDETLQWDNIYKLSGYSDCNFAARVMGIADGGQIVVSEQAKGALETNSYDWREWRNRRIKSFETAPVKVYTLGWEHLHAHREPGIALVPEWTREENRYIARTELENRIIDCFKRRGDDKPSFRLVTLHGFGGAGKTRLATKCCLLMLPIFESRVRIVRLELLTVNENTDGATRRDLLAQAIADSYGLTGDEAKPENLAQSLPHAINLLFLDNYESVACRESAILITQLIEKNREIHILVTGRVGVLNPNLEKMMRVEMLDRATARELLLDRVRMKPGRDDWQPSSIDEAAIEEILTLTEGHPLSLVLVAARADKKSLREIAGGLGKTSLGRETTLPVNHIYDDDAMRHKSLQLCLDYSWGLLEVADRRALCCLSLFADDFSGHDVSECFPEGGAKQDCVTEDSLEHLQDSALLNREERAATGESFYSMLRPTKEYAEGKRATLEGIENAVSSYVRRYRRLMEMHIEGVETQNPESLTALDLHYRNVITALTCALMRDAMDDVSALYDTLTEYFVHRALYTEKRVLEESVLALRRKVLPEGHPHIATSLNNLALFYYSQGRYAETEPHYKEVLKMSRAALPTNHRDIATSLNNLAELYREQGRYDEA